MAKTKTSKIKIKLMRSTNKSKDDIIGTIRALGIKRLYQVVEHDDNPVIRGMIFKVKHLVEVVN